MSRLSIEIGEHQHQQIKALAALRGVSIKDYILEKTLSPLSAEDQPEAEALAELEAALAPALVSAEHGEILTLTMDEILAEARANYKA